MTSNHSNGNGNGHNGNGNAERLASLFGAAIRYNPCPHCGLNSLIKEGKGQQCFQCCRDFGPTGRRFISERREIERGCYPNGKVHKVMVIRMKALAYTPL